MSGAAEIGAERAAHLIAAREARHAAGLARLNALPEAEAVEALTRCCGAARWVRAMAAQRPFASSWALLIAARTEWVKAGREEILEAFGHHPRIGDLDSLRSKFASTAAWASGEQRGAEGADDQLLRNLAEGNAEYQAQFGWIFIVCATGKSAREMLGLLWERLENPPDLELQIAAAEQEKITRLRLEKLLEGEP